MKNLATALPFPKMFSGNGVCLPLTGEPPENYVNPGPITPTEQISGRNFMLTYFWLGVGGATGTIFRYWLGGVISNYFPTFPMGTLVINVTGSFLITFFGTLTDTDGRWLVSPTGRMFFMTGICGGYTTF